MIACTSSTKPGSQVGSKPSPSPRFTWLGQTEGQPPGWLDVTRLPFSLATTFPRIVVPEVAGSNPVSHPPKPSQCHSLRGFLFLPAGYWQHLSGSCVQFRSENLAGPVLLHTLCRNNLNSAPTTAHNTQPSSDCRCSASSSPLTSADSFFCRFLTCQTPASNSLPPAMMATL